MPTSIHAARRSGHCVGTDTVILTLALYGFFFIDVCAVDAGPSTLSSRCSSHTVNEPVSRTSRDDDPTYTPNVPTKGKKARKQSVSGERERERGDG